VSQIIPNLRVFLNGWVVAPELPSKCGSLLATNTNNESSPTTTTIRASASHALNPQRSTGRQPGASNLPDVNANVQNRCHDANPLKWLTQIQFRPLWYSSPADVDPETSAPHSFNSSMNSPFRNDSSAKLLYEAARLFSIWVYQTILLLRFPAMYSRRVAGSNGHQVTAGDSGTTVNGKYIWEEFIDSLVREWKMSTGISGLLTLCIFSDLPFQIQSYK